METKPFQSRMIFLILIYRFNLIYQAPAWPIDSKIDFSITTPLIIEYLSNYFDFNYLLIHLKKISFVPALEKL